jgi:hypothetical protein
VDNPTNILIPASALQSFPEVPVWPEPNTKKGAEAPFFVSCRNSTIMFQKYPTDG